MYEQSEEWLMMITLFLEKVGMLEVEIHESMKSLHHCRLRRSHDDTQYGFVGTVISDIW